MENHDLKIEITKDGKVHVTVEGVKGKSCLKYGELLRQLVGKIARQELTPEYYEPDVQVQLDLEKRQENRERL